MRFLYIFNFFIIAQTILRAQPIQVTVSADTNVIFIGDHLRVQMVVNAPKSIEVLYPALKTLLADSVGWELLTLSEMAVEPSGSNNIYKQTATVTCWKDGQKIFPALPFVYRQAGAEQTVSSSTLTIEVQSPPLVDSTYIADIKPILAEPYHWTDYWVFFLIGGLLVLIPLAIWFILKLRVRIAQGKIRTPEELALERLHTLRNSNVLKTNEFGIFHETASYILRDYLDKRFAIPALPRPTSEIGSYIDFHADIDKSFRVPLREVLETADLVKFAKASPLPAANDFALSTIEQFVKTIQQRLAEEAKKKNKK